MPNKEVDLVVKVMDPIEKMIVDWINTNIVPEVEAQKEGPLTELDGVSVSLKSLKTMILNCFDDIQELMMASVRGKNETLH